jgi:hypothetical protein
MAAISAKTPAWVAVSSPNEDVGSPDLASDLSSDVSPDFFAALAAAPSVNSAFSPERAAAAAGEASNKADAALGAPVAEGLVIWASAFCARRAGSEMGGDDAKATVLTAADTSAELVRFAGTDIEGEDIVIEATVGAVATEPSDALVSEFRLPARLASAIAASPATGDGVNSEVINIVRADGAVCATSTPAASAPPAI